MNTGALRFFRILIISGVLSLEGEGVIYHVLPTEKVGFCQTGNSMRCPPGWLCYTMDYFILAEHSSEFFSPDHVNVTLIFMCGVHNYTKDLTVQNLQSFVMRGAAETCFTEQNLHLIIQSQQHLTVHLLIFLNISFVNITTLTMRCPSINFDSGLLMVQNSNLHGYAGTMEALSSISVKNAGSQALLNNCSFKEK